MTKRLPSKWKDRFDLGLKMILADRINRGLFSSSATMDYLNHIYLWNGFREPATPKIGHELFLSTFQSLVKHFKASGVFTTDPIPVSPDGRVLNGIHRLAASLTCGIEPQFALSYNNNDNFDFAFFRNASSGRGRFGRLMLLKMLQRNLTVWRHFKVGIIFPRAMKMDHGNFALEAIKRHNSLLWAETLSVHPNFVRFLLLNAYPSDSWLGIGSGLKGLTNKSDEVMDQKSSNQLIMIALFDENGSRSATDLKKEIRRRYNIGKSSIHISDDYIDSLSLARAYCSSASTTVPFAKFNFHSQSLHKLSLLSRQLLQLRSSIATDHLVVGSTALELFGGREAKDIDLLGIPENSREAKIFTHNQYFFQYGKSIVDLVDDLDMQYSLFGLSIASPQLVLRQKAIRSEPKDDQDIKFYQEAIASN